ncbi:head-tail connector protein [Marinisporobacter balticus]|uniref:Putative phage protein (Predicted DNA packaging) n=1 Tax=Marinisporobacter balticus TaxID=2018667 RepID=A0A4R2KGD1_9FIRM|nr:head-tail connector protein [Marinisporobacter balticus]TCO69506.1 putative phage protein (predicted DNA packaging) [Marinisporobacter balticus]
MLLDKIKNSLRADGTDLDEEIQDLIDAAKADLKLSGVLESKIIDTDPLIIRAVTVYCKANYSTDGKEAERFQESYEMIKTHMTLSCDYTDTITDETVE